MITHSTEARNAMAQAVADLVDQGSTYSYPELSILDSTGNTLSTFQMSYPAFNPPVEGQLVAKEISNGTPISAGTAESYRVKNRDGVEVFRGAVGLSGEFDLILPRLSITAQSYINILNFTYNASN